MFLSTAELFHRASPEGWDILVVTDVESAPSEAMGRDWLLWAYRNPTMLFAVGDWNALADDSERLALEARFGPVLCEKKDSGRVEVVLLPLEPHGGKTRSQRGKLRGLTPSGIGSRINNRKSTAFRPR